MAKYQAVDGNSNDELRILELFAGIGGLAAAVQQIDSPQLKVTHAVDIDRDARDVYKLNFDHPYKIADISSLELDFFKSINANVWWLSPPCPPFSIRGRSSRSQQNHVDDLSDNRNLALIKVSETIASVRPPVIIIENVPGFECSQTWNRVAQSFSASDYSYEVFTICPSEFNWPNRRRRVYIVATHNEDFFSARFVMKLPNAHELSTHLDSFIDPQINRDTHPELYLSNDIILRYGSACDRIELGNPNNRTTACFASSYGKTILHAGSYLVLEDGIRRFASQEVQRILGFHDSFQWPSHLSERRKWNLLGNSLAIPVVVALLRSLMDFRRIHSPKS